MQEIYFGEFRKIVVLHIREIGERNPEYQSTEWFLLQYLKRIEKNTIPPASFGKVENSMRALIRFYVDMIDERSELGERCRLINGEYRRVLRKEQEG
jgi:hypothetical protein